MDGFLSLRFALLCQNAVTPELSKRKSVSRKEEYASLSKMGAMENGLDGEKNFALSREVLLSAVFQLQQQPLL